MAGGSRYLLALEANAPWWLLTHSSAGQRCLHWLDGAAILTYIFGASLLIGGALWLLLRAAVRVMRRGDNVFQHWRWRWCCWAAPGCFGLSATTVKLLRYEGFLLAWAQPARAALLIGAIAWSLYLARTSSVATAATACAGCWRSPASTPAARWWAMAGGCASGAGEPPAHGGLKPTRVPLFTPASPARPGPQEHLRLTAQHEGRKQPIQRSHSRCWS